MKENPILVILGIVALLVITIILVQNQSPETFSIQDTYTCPGSIQECSTCDKFVWTMDRWKLGTCSLSHAVNCASALTINNFGNNLIQELDPSNGNYSSTAVGTMSCVDNCNTCEYTEYVLNNPLYSSSKILSCKNNLQTVALEYARLYQETDGTYSCVDDCDTCEQIKSAYDSGNLLRYNQCKYLTQNYYSTEYARWGGVGNPTCAGTPTVTCNDTDGGNDIYIKGTLSFYSSGGWTTLQPDRCIEGQIYENYCANGMPSSSRVNCPSGYFCSDGSCVSSIACSTIPLNCRTCQTILNAQNIWSQNTIGCQEEFNRCTNEVQNFNFSEYNRWNFNTASCSVIVTCSPSCAGKTCGSNGCGGSCGTCSSGYNCISGSCTSGASNQTAECGEGFTLIDNACVENINFFMQEVFKIGEFSVKWWMLFAAVGGIILLLLLI